MSKLNPLISQLSKDLLDEIDQKASVKNIPKGTTILREGQYVKVIPIVTEGLIKVFTRHGDKDLLLYYIQPAESCIMSFAASLGNSPSKVLAITEEDTTAILLPSDLVQGWVRQFPDLNNLFFRQFNLRYSDLLDTIQHVLFHNLDTRLLNYLREKVHLTGKNPLHLSHRQIANELGTAREVVSRVIKKLENEGKIKQYASNIELL